MDVLILSAMKNEMLAILDMCHASENEIWGRQVFYTGHWKKLRIALGSTGVGKVMSAMNTQRAIDKYHPRYIIMVGVAGALNPEYTIGDIVLGKETMLHDMNVSSLGFAKGEIPYAKIRIILADLKLLEIAQSYFSANAVVRQGRILTGDTFVTNDHKHSLYRELQGDAVEMEGASVAIVATSNQIPHIVLRIISDQADGRAKVDFEHFLPQASCKLAGILQHILENLSKGMSDL